MNNQDQGKQQD